nr:hypothetical protein [Haloarchaeobius salinus]
MVNLTTEYDITVAVSSGVSRAYVPYTGQGTMFVSPSDVTNGHTLAHEYIHLQQGMHFSSEMEWLVEGSAVYYATQTIHDREVLESNFESRMGSGSEIGDTLSNRDSWDDSSVEYEKGAIVEMLLDFHLQQHESSLEKVRHGMNQRLYSEPVTYTEFRQIVVERTNRTVGDYMDRWIRGSGVVRVSDSAHRFLLTQRAENLVEASGNMTPETPMILNIDGRLSPSELVLTGHQRVYNRYVKENTEEGGKHLIYTPLTCRHESCRSKRKPDYSNGASIFEHYPVLNSILSNGRVRLNRKFKDISQHIIDISSDVIDIAVKPVSLLKLVEKCCQPINY